MHSLSHSFHALLNIPLQDVSFSKNHVWCCSGLPDLLERGKVRQSVMFFEEMSQEIGRLLNFGVEFSQWKNEMKINSRLEESGRSGGK